MKKEADENFIITVSTDTLPTTWEITLRRTDNSSRFWGDNTRRRADIIALRILSTDADDLVQTLEDGL